jgi:hypothetical protein
MGKLNFLTPMKKVAAVAAKVFKYKKLARNVSGVILFFASLVSLAQPLYPLPGGINIQSFNQCQIFLSEQCKDSSISCFIVQAAKVNDCSQTLVFLKFTNRLPSAVVNYGNIDVVQTKNPEQANEINYLIVDKSGQIILPQTDLDLTNVPGFLALKNAYPNVIVVAQLLGYPQAVYLSQEAQQLAFLQPLVDMNTQKLIAYVKVLFTFTVDGQYKGQYALRVFAIPTQG